MKKLTAIFLSILLLISSFALDLTAAGWFNAFGLPGNGISLLAAEIETPVSLAGDNILYGYGNVTQNDDGSVTIKGDGATFKLPIKKPLQSGETIKIHVKGSSRAGVVRSFLADQQGWNAASNVVEGDTICNTVTEETSFDSTFELTANQETNAVMFKTSWNGTLDVTITSLSVFLPESADTAATAITVTPGTCDLKVGEVRTLVASIDPPESDDTVVWSSNDPCVSVNQAGVITAVSAGNATIKAESKTNSEVYGECTVNVNVAEDITAKNPDGKIENQLYKNLTANTFENDGNAHVIYVNKTFEQGKTYSFRIVGYSNSHFRMWIGSYNSVVETPWSSDSSGYSGSGDFDLIVTLTVKSELTPTDQEQLGSIAFKEISYGANLKDLVIRYVAELTDPSTGGEETEHTAEFEQSSVLNFYVGGNPVSTQEITKEGTYTISHSNGGGIGFIVLKGNTGVEPHTNFPEGTVVKTVSLKINGTEYQVKDAVKSVTVGVDGNVEIVYHPQGNIIDPPSDLKGTVEVTFSVIKPDHICSVHKPLRQVEAKEATCDKEGVKPHYVCDVCGKTYSDADGLQETFDVVIPKSAHTTNDEWKSDELSHWKECSVCNQQVEKSAHGPADDSGKCPTCQRSLTHTAEFAEESVLGLFVSVNGGGAVSSETTVSQENTFTLSVNASGSLTYILLKGNTGEKVSDGNTNTKLPAGTRIVTQSLKIDGKEYELKGNAPSYTVSDDGKVDVWYYLTYTGSDNIVDRPASVESSIEVTFSVIKPDHICSAHKPLTRVEAQDATCEKEGIIAHYVCDVCGKTYSDEDGTMPLDKVTSDKIAHTPSSKWSHDADSHWQVCDVCGEKIEETVTAHDLKYKDWTSTQHHKTCEVCGYQTELEAHVYGEPDENHNRKCTECGYTEYHSHILVWNGDEQEHWKECSDCEYTTERSTHNWNGYVWKQSDQDEFHYKTCDTCPYQLKEAHELVKKFDDSLHWQECAKCELQIHSTVARHGELVTKFDNDYHWKACEDECGYETEKTAHTLKEVIDKPATETEDGSKHSECDCGYRTESEKIPSTGCHHESLKAVPKKEATCTEEGYEAYWQCENCDKLFSDADCSTEIDAPKVIEKLPHTYDDTWTKKDDTYHSHTCKTCGGEEVTEEHSWDNGKITVQPTCTDNGVKTYTCTAKGCGAQRTEEISATGHKAKKVESKAATCTEAGYEAYWQCENCNKLFSDADCSTEIEAPKVIEKLPHTYDDTWTKKDDTYHSHTCKTCGGEEVTEEHSWDNGKITAQPTCTDKGVKTYTCTAKGCGAKRTEEISAEGHKTEKVEGKAATCTEDGIKEHYKCSVCEKLFSDSEGKNAITEADTVIKAAGHTWDGGLVYETPNCVLKGEMLYRCTVCGERRIEEIPIDPYNHIGQEILSDYVEATENNPGYTGNVRCSACNAIIHMGAMVPAITPPADAPKEYVSHFIGKTDGEKTTLSWTNAIDADEYVIYFKVEGSDIWKKAGTVKGTSVKIKGMKPGKDYSFVVVANGNVSGILEISLDDTGMIVYAQDRDDAILLNEIPEIIDAFSETEGTADVIWTPASNAASYRIYAAEGSSTVYSNKGTFGTNSGRIFGLMSGKMYKIRVVRLPLYADLRTVVKEAKEIVVTVK